MHEVQKLRQRQKQRLVSTDYWMIEIQLEIRIEIQLDSLLQYGVMIHGGDSLDKWESKLLGIFHGVGCGFESPPLRILCKNYALALPETCSISVISRCTS